MVYDGEGVDELAEIVMEDAVDGAEGNAFTVVDVDVDVLITFAVDDDELTVSVF